MVSTQEATLPFPFFFPVLFSPLSFSRQHYIAHSSAVAEGTMFLLYRPLPPLPLLCTKVRDI